MENENDQSQKIIESLKRFVPEKQYSYFVVDIKHIDNRIIVKYLDGHETEEEYVEHNFNEYYRYRMTRQINETVLPNLNDQINATISNRGLQNRMVITSLIGMFISYGVDANEFFKVLFTVSLVYSLLNRILSNKAYLKQLRSDANTLIPLITYVSNEESYKFVNPETKKNDSLINVEDVYRGIVRYR